MKLSTSLKPHESRYGRSFLLLPLFILIHQVVIAQQCLDTSVRRQYNAQNGLTVRSQQTLNDGSILVNAFKTNPITSNVQTTIIKLAPDGTVIWSNSLETGDNSAAIEIQQILAMASGSYMIAGTLSETNANKVLIAKLNSAGAILWRRSFTLNSPALTTPVFTGVYALAEQPVTGNLYGSLQVSTVASGGSSFEVNVVAAFDQNGTSLWAKNLYHPTIESYTNFSGLEVINNSVITIAETAMNFNDTEPSPAFVYSKLDAETGQLNLVRCHKIIADPLDSTTVTGSYANPRLHSQASLKTVTGEIIYYGSPIYSSLKDGIMARFDSIGNFLSGRNLFLHTSSPFFYQPISQVYATPNGRLITLISGNNLFDTYITVYDSLFRLEQQQKISSVFLNFNNSGLFKNISVNAGEDAIHVLHNYSQSNGLGGFLYHFEFQKFFMGQAATNCFGTEGWAEILSNMEVQEQPFSYQSIQDVTLTETIHTVSLVPLTVNASTLCSYYSNCNTVAIIEAPVVCHLDRAYTFKATKGTVCNKRVLWVFLPAANNSITQLNDSTVSVIFLDDWQGQVIASLSGNCHISDTLDFALQLSPDAVFLGNDLALCPQAVQVLDAGNDFKSYTWNDGSSLQHLTVSTPGTYWVIAENFCGEFYSDTIILTASAYSLNIGPTEEKCNLDTIKIIRNGVLQNYAVSPDDNYSVSANEISFWPLHTTTYAITAQTPDGCTLGDTMRIVVANSPPLNFGPDAVFCTGDSLLLSAGNLFSNYTWSDGFTGPQRWVRQSGIYQLAATYSNGCISRDTINILPPIPLPVINLPKKPAVCIGQNNTLTAPVGYDSYLWQDGSTLSSYVVTSPGRYFVTVVEQGCNNSDTVEIIKVGTAITNFLPVDTSICYSDKIIVCSRQVENAYSYLWSNGSSGSCTDIDRPGIYTLRLTNSDGCSNTEEIEIREKQCPGDIYFPNSFTPNNDNLNDTYKPKTYSRLKLYKISIFNRWGQRVFSTQNISEGWDGRFTGAKQEQGVYTWYCEYAFDGKEKNSRKGTLLLIR